MRVYPTVTVDGERPPESNDRRIVRVYDTRRDTNLASVPIGSGDAPQAHGEADAHAGRDRPTTSGLHAIEKAIVRASRGGGRLCEFGRPCAHAKSEEHVGGLWDTDDGALLASFSCVGDWEQCVAGGVEPEGYQGGAKAVEVFEDSVKERWCGHGRNVSSLTGAAGCSGCILFHDSPTYTRRCCNLS